jgi:competence protein ComEC
VLLAYGQTRLLFMADVDADAEEAILASGLSVQADVLKVGHHGSNSASSPAFISQVNPSVAVYSASSGNDYGHPHAETLATLSQTGAQVYGTDVNGTIVVASDGVDHTVRVSRQGEARAPPSRAPTLVPQPKAPERPAVSAPASTSDALSIEIVSLTSPIARGSDARLRIKTVPGAACTIEVVLDPKNWTLFRRS